MARPGRRLWVPRAYARRRHRTWMWSMTLASLGWGCWWLYLFLARFWPEWKPTFETVGTVSSVFAFLGLLVALLTVRARGSWLLFTAVALGANGSLLVLPWFVRDLLAV